jgi:hypothetical protein
VARAFAAFAGFAAFRSVSLAQVSANHIQGGVSLTIAKTNTRMTPLGAAARGALAGAMGTTLMDLVGYVRYKTGGGESNPVDWEFMPGLKEWSKAPAPAQIGKRLYEGMLQRPLPDRYVPLTNNLTHWLYGIGWGALFGMVVGSTRATRTPRALAGPPFGALVWGASYVILPLAKLYKPIWDYDKPTLAKDLGTHLVYGAGVSTLFSLLSGS